MPPEKNKNSKMDSKITKKIKNPKFKEYVLNVISQVYQTGGLAKGLKEVTSKIKRAKLLLVVENIADEKYKQKVEALIKCYSGLICELPEIDSLASILEKPKFKCGIAAIYHMPKKIITQFSGYEHIEWNSE